jgi:hypothetical protein
MGLGRPRPTHDVLLISDLLSGVPGLDPQHEVAVIPSLVVVASFFAEFAWPTMVI